MAEERRSAEQVKPPGTNPLRVLRNRNFSRLFFAGFARTRDWAYRESEAVKEEIVGEPRVR